MMYGVCVCALVCRVCMSVYGVSAWCVCVVYNLCVCVGCMCGTCLYR